MRPRSVPPLRGQPRGAVLLRRVLVVPGRRCRMTQCASRCPNESASEAVLWRRDKGRCFKAEGHDGQHECPLVHRWTDEEE